MSSDLDNYIAQLNPLEQKVLHIAREHLETSFSLRKSIGFQEWHAKVQASTCEAVTCEAVTCEAVTCEAVTCEAVTCEAVTCEAVTCEALAKCEITAPPPVIVRRKIKIRQLNLKPV